jgi:GEVED domain/Secretion system C-terminal sorting domain
METSILVQASVHIKIMKQISTIIRVIFLALVLTSSASIYGQNTTGNAWQVWTPDRNIGNETNRNVFSINSLTNRLQYTGPVNTARCYGLGNDRRGYIYFGDETNNQIHCMDPNSNTVLSSLPYGTNITSPHCIQGFYIATTNQHFIAISNSSSNINTAGTVTILDVTNPNAIAFVKNITVPVAIADGSRSTGMDLVQSSYSSSGTTLYISVDDGTKNDAGGSSTTGIFLKVNDPLAASPAIAAYRTYYPAGTGSTTFSLEYSHSIQVDDANNKVYVSGTSYSNPFGINLGAILSFSTTGVPSYNVYLYNTDPDGSQPGLFHTISFNKNGNDFYVGSGYDDGGNRAFRFTTQADKTQPTVIAPAAISPILNYGTKPAGSGWGFVMGVNLIPDASKLYAILESNYGTAVNTSKTYDLDPATLVINSAVKNKAGTADETFGYIDPHSYAFNLYDYGDAPATYGTAAHYLNNNDYVNDRLRIGTTIDADSATAFSANFDGDDVRATPKSGDEDGITPAYISGTSGLWYGMTGTYTIPNIQVQNSTLPAVTATLLGWIDFNHDGIFQSTEGTTVSVPNGTTSVSLNWAIPTTVTTGRVVLRLRLTTDPLVTTATPASIAYDGEAEDYVFPQTIPVSGNVFNDVNGNTIYGSTGLPGSGEAGTTGGVNLYAYMILNGVIVDSAKVAADGSYSFKNVQQNMGAVTVVIGSNSIAPGAAFSSVNNISTNPPAGWVYTGSSQTGSTNGALNNISINIAFSPYTGLNFGIQPAAAMPLHLISFSGKIGNNGVVLNWVTTNEQNVKWHIIQKSSDAVNYIDIDTIAASNLFAATYNALDAHPYSCKNYYRLRSVDIDGQHSLSNIVLIQNNCKQVNFILYPNPVTDQLNISGLKIGEQVELYCTDGKLLVTQKVTASTQQLDMSKYAKGMYEVIIVNAAERVFATKIIKY